MLKPETDIDWSRLYKMEPFHREPPEEYAFRAELAEAAKKYLARQPWCKKVLEVWWGDGLAPKVGAFLIRFEPAEWSKAEGYMWVIVGDLPPAYMWPGDCRNVYQALNGYCGAMKMWADAANAGTSVDKLIPVNVAPTKGHASMLLGRLELIDEMFLEPNERLLDAPVAADRDEGR
jgi:hypothetical protein